MYFCKIFLDLGVNAFLTNFLPTSIEALFPASKAFLAPSLAMVLPKSTAEDVNFLATLLAANPVYKLAIGVNIPEPPNTYFVLNLCFGTIIF